MNLRPTGRFFIHVAMHGKHGITLPGADKTGSTTSERTEKTGEEMPNDFQPIETQEDLDRIIKDRLARERKAVEAKYSDYDGLKAKVEELEAASGGKDGDLEEAKKRISKLEADIAEREGREKLSVLRAKVAKETGVPLDVVSALGATDEEKLTEQAKAMAKWAKPKSSVHVSGAGKFGDGAEDPKDAAKRELVHQMFGTPED